MPQVLSFTEQFTDGGPVLSQVLVLPLSDTRNPALDQSSFDIYYRLP